MRKQDGLSTIENRYIFERQLGKGAMGTVFLVYDEKLGKRWALKLMDNRSETELTALKQLSHPSFPRIVDYGISDEGAFIVMDYIEGVSLRQYINGRRCNERERIDIAIKLAQALNHLHNSTPAMLYLDCKPDNIIITPDGSLKLVDMGSIYLKDMANPGRISGTAGFASPEQRRGDSVDITSDVYAYGETIRRIISANGDERLKAIVRRCTVTNPRNRYQSMNEIIYELSHNKLIFTIKWMALFLANTFIKSMLAFFTILSFKVYADSNSFLYLILGCLLIYLCCLSLNGQRDRISMNWNCVQDIHMGRGSKLLGVIIATLLTAIVFGQSNSYANERYRVTLYDAEGYKILYRDQRVVVNDDMSIDVYIPAENVTTATIPVRAEWSLK